MYIYQGWGQILSKYLNTIANTSSVPNTIANTSSVPNTIANTITLSNKCI